MSDWDLFTGQPLPDRERPRFWSQTAAAQWHREAASKAERIGTLERQIAAIKGKSATDAAMRHSLFTRLAALTGVGPPPYEPPPAEPPPSSPRAAYDEEGARRLVAELDRERDLRAQQAERQARHPDPDPRRAPSVSRKGYKYKPQRRR